MITARPKFQITQPASSSRIASDVHYNVSTLSPAWNPAGVEEWLSPGAAFIVLPLLFIDTPKRNQNSHPTISAGQDRGYP